MTRVVLAEDDIDLSEGLTQLLEINKIDVVGIGTDGKQASELCEKYEPDFLLLDLSMPKYDGFYAIEKLEKMKSMKIIVITGMIDKNIMEKLRSYSVFSIQRKPLEFNELIKLLQ